MKRALAEREDNIPALEFISPTAAVIARPPSPLATSWRRRGRVGRSPPCSPA